MFWFPNRELGTSNKLFCSGKCYHLYRKKNPNEYPINGEYHTKRNIESKLGKNNPNYSTGAGFYKRLAKEMFGNVCQNCGSAKDIHVHHIDFNHGNNPEDGSNWKILCRSCHSTVHDFTKNFKGKEPWRK
jgi:5-methylcytosine-specific restriction endonuclease McrA